MAGDWEQTTVGELVARGVLNRPLDGNHGSIHPKGSDFVPSGVPFIMASDLVNGGIDTIGCSFISLAQANSLRKGFARRGDVLLSHKATLGRTAIVGEIPGEFVMLTPQVTYYRPTDPAKLDNRYLKYYFDSYGFQQVLQSWAGAGSTRAYIGITDQLRLPILLPPPAQQRAIAHVLGTLDDKIELNRRMSETLESMARALFRSWLDQERPSRVPVAELISDGVLELGDGYRAKNTELGSPGLPFIRAGDLQGGIHTKGAELLRQASVNKAGSKVSRVGDVAFTSKGTIGRFARVSRHTARCVYSPQVCYWRSLDAKALHPAVLYAWMTSEDLASQILAVAGQTDMALYVSLTDQRRMEMPRLPASHLLIGRQLEPLFERQDEAGAESLVLAHTRDALLPRLISGMLGFEN